MDIDVNLLCWQDLFLTCVDQFIPKIRIKDPNRPPWIDADVLHLIRKKERVRRKARLTDSPYQWEKFRKIRSEVKKLIKFNKRYYIDKLGYSLKTNPKKFWSYYKLITKTSRIPSEISYGQVNATKHMDQANLFNAFFHSVFASEDTSVDVDRLPELNYNVTSELSSIVMNTNALSNYLKSLDTSKASMGIPTKLLKECANEVAPSLCLLFNLCIERGVFPDKWKNINMVPIHKCESKALVPNYRGISLLDILSKVMEKQVYDRLFDSVKLHLCKWQYGFLPGRSTVSQLIQVVHEYATALEKKQQVDVIYLDFAKAFDKVSHNKLLYKLESFGIKGNLLSWFQAYLLGRQHRVVINGKASDYLPITSGVPQGSVLGPLLFLIYINDMPKCISRETSLPLFADDSKCFRVILGQEDGNALQNDLNRLLDWAKTWGMEFNLSKCKVMRITRKKVPFERDYYLGNWKLNRVIIEKDLGILISHNLNWNEHIDFIVSKSHRMLNLLYRTCKDISDTQVKKQLYLTWVRSRLEYACPVWSPYTKRNIRALEQVQRKATRFIVGKDLNYNERLLKLELLPLIHRREILDLIFFYKCFKGICELDISQYVSFRINTRNLRSIDNLTLSVHFSRTEAFKNSYFIRICRLWNGLPLNVRESESLAIFRRKLYLLYNGKCYYE